jgi:chromosome segregation ATPase
MSDELTEKLSDDSIRLILDGLKAIDTRLATLETRLATVEEKVDRRLQETRPIWEQVLVRIEKVETIQDEFRTEVRQSFRTLERRLSVLSDDIVAVRADQKDLASRLDKLESERPQ